jgi:DNA-binding transcriptional LysR family regulator
MRASRDDLHLLCRIIETGSLRAAATELGIDPSNVTRRLGGLEAQLGVKLIHRARARSTPTDAGRAYYRELVGLLERLDALDSEVGGAAAEPRGTLRIAAPSVFGARHVGPWLVELQRRAPELELDLRLGDGPLDLVEHAIDLAIRIGPLADSSYAATRLGTMHTAIVGAPAYLERVGAPESPDELARHELVQHAGLFERGELVLEGPGRRTATVAYRGRVRASSILGVMHAVLAGAGLNAGPLWLYADAIARGELVHVLPRWHPEASAVHALVVPGRYRPAKIRAALELVRECVPRLPGISRE